MNNTRAIFTNAGLSYEFPGFYDARIPANGLNFTVGINGEGCGENPADDSLFSVQIVSDEGECVAAQDIQGASNVAACFKLIRLL